MVVLTLAYNGAAQLSFHLEFAGPVAAIMWLPVGVAIGFLYYGGVHLWPGVVAGDLMANDYSALPVWAAIAQTVGNVVEVVVATMLIRRLVPRGSPLESIGGLGRLLVALTTGTVISATVGTLSLRIAGVVHMDNVPTVWRTWWLGDFVGALVVVPFALAWYRPLKRRWPPARIVEAAALLVAVVVLSEISSRSDRPVVYIVFPALIWAAIRFGPRGATLAIAIAVGFTVSNTTHYLGPFAYHSITRSVLNTQLFIGVAALSTLYLSALVSEREGFARELGASRSRLVEAADVERRRLERNLHDGAQQRLTWLAVDLRRAAARARKSPEEAPALLEKAEAELELAIDELRDLAHGIHPSVLTDLGLATASRRGGRDDRLLRVRGGGRERPEARVCVVDRRLDCLSRSGAPRRGRRRRRRRRLRAGLRPPGPAGPGRDHRRQLPRHEPTRRRDGRHRDDPGLVRRAGTHAGKDTVARRGGAGRRRRRALKSTLTAAPRTSLGQEWVASTADFSASNSASLRTPLSCSDASRSRSA